MTKTFTVKLEDDTVGTVCDSTLNGQHPDAFLFEQLTVELHDENGNPFEKTGKLAEVLEEN